MIRSKTLVLAVLLAPIIHSARVAAQTGDTLLLEDVTVRSLPFQETSMESTGGLFVARTSEMDTDLQLSSAGLYNQIPGIFMASGTWNTNRLTIRGIGSRTPYSTNRIRAYLDDIPLTSGDGVSTVEDIDPLAMGQLEVLKGPASALYGSGLGGAVRIQSPYPEKSGFSGSLLGEAGSFNSRKYGLTLAYKGNRQALFAGATRSASDGFRENSRYSRNNIFLHARHFGAVHSFRLTVMAIDLFSQIPSSLNEQDFRANPEKAAANWLAVEGHETYRKVLAGAGWEASPGNRLTNELILFGVFSDPYESRPFNILDDRSVSTGVREYLQYRTPGFSMGIGVELFTEWVDWQIYETLGGDRGNILSDHSERRSYANLFALAQWRFRERLLIDAGINANLLQYRLETRLSPDPVTGPELYRYDPVASPRLGISYRHRKNLYTYFSAGHGFSAPSLEETLMPEGQVNTSLKPETGWSLEAGNRGRLLNGLLAYDLTAYIIWLDDLLVTERIAEDIFTGANAGNARFSGLEAHVHLDLFRDNAEGDFRAWTTAGGNLSTNRFVEFVDEGTDYSGNHLPGIPAQRVKGSLGMQYRMLEGEFGYSYTGKQRMQDSNQSLYPGYHLLQIRTSVKMTPKTLPVRFRIHFGIRNLLNTRYASMILINAPSFGGALPRYYYPGQPRQFYAGVRVDFPGK